MPLAFTPSVGTLNKIVPIRQTLAINQAVLTAFRKPTLAELAAHAPRRSSLGSLSTALHLAPELLPRINAGRQPITRSLALLLDELLGLPEGTTASVCAFVTDLETPVAYVPVPPVRELGDTLSFAPLAKTVEVIAPT